MRNIRIEQELINRINAKRDFTYPPKEEGYIVGIKTLHRSLNPSMKYDKIYEDVYAFVKENDMTTTIGGWTDSDGTYYVDLGNQYLVLDMAIKVAKSLGQKAIWDCENGKEIRVDNDKLK